MSGNKFKFSLHTIDVYINIKHLKFMLFQFSLVYRKKRIRENG